MLTDENLRREFDANTPMKRPGTPEDIAAAALYFASPASSWVTGKLLARRRWHRAAVGRRAGAPTAHVQR